MIDLEVAVAVPLEQTLTYRVTSFEGTEKGRFFCSQLIGRRVLVPLGRRKVTGYVLGEAQDTGDRTFAVRRVSKFLDDRPLFHANIVSFYRWVANYYHYPIGLVIKAALPGGLAPKSFKKVYL
ncbi:MAG: primosomal protein N' family DNA-binding protein, partial [Desulforhopalus sp.]